MKTILILMRKWFGLKTLQYQQSLEKIVWLFLVQNHYNTKWFGAKTVNNLVQKHYKEILVKTRIIFFENLFRRRYYFHSLPTIFVIIGDKVQDWIGKRLMNLFKSYTLISLFLAHENFIMQNAFRVSGFFRIFQDCTSALIDSLILAANNYFWCENVTFWRIAK